MDSSTVIAFRALVMLTCLIVVPLAAVLGSAFPDVVRSVVVDRLVRPGGAAKAGDEAARAQAGEAPAFGFVPPTVSLGAPAAPATIAWPATAETGAWAQTAAAGPQPDFEPLHTTPNSASPFATPAAATSAGSEGAVVPARAETPVGAAEPAWPDSLDLQASFPAPSRAAPSVNAATPNATTQGAPGGSAYPSVIQNPAADPPSGTAQQAGGGDRFSQLERQLRQYGATYYLLETWGPEGELYRFHCKMAVANNPNSARHFEATDSDGLRAMTRVIEQVAAWRQGRSE